MLLFLGLPLGNFLGGVFGLSIAGAVSGAPIESGPIARTLVLGGMLTGLLAASGSFLFVAAILRRVITSRNAAWTER